MLSYLGFIWHRKQRETQLDLDQRLVLSCDSFPVMSIDAECLQCAADGLSRSTLKEVLLPGDMVLTLEDCPVKVTSTRAWTAKDPIRAILAGSVLGAEL